MSYQSIDSMQEALSTGVFKARKDSRKAAGRALGTLVELITFYLLKDYGLLPNMCIERPLAEYANNEISHNVEFTLHPSIELGRASFLADDSLTMTYLKRATGLTFNEAGYVTKSNNPYKKGNLCNAATLLESDDSLINAYADCSNSIVSIRKLAITPFAMFECKRVGVEKGMKKGPQTIEKAKQGAYVSRVVSKLQRFRRADGTVAGVYEDCNGVMHVGEYDSLLAQLIQNKDAASLNNLVITVGIISNHGNWFTRDHQNKETKVLSQSYDWLLFLTDNGLTKFIRDAVLGDDPSLFSTREAFLNCYDDTGKKASFTKKLLPAAADKELTRYFRTNREEIASWFNILTPAGGSLEQLMNELLALAESQTRKWS